MYPFENKCFSIILVSIFQYLIFKGRFIDIKFYFRDTCMTNRKSKSVSFTKIQIIENQNLHDKFCQD